MKGDFSRSTFDPAKHYSGVRMQQGRVQLDADWNENLDILRRRIETETIDVIGECGVPANDAGFGVVTDFNSLSQAEKNWLTEQGFKTLGNGDFYLTQGRAYVDGIQIENEHTLPFSQQPFVLPKSALPITGAGTYLLYLDVWERHITALEDPSVREVALGGPDTATRTQVVWQAALTRVGDVGSNVTCADDLHSWPSASTGTLSAHTTPAQQPDNPCTVPAGAGYKRLENQLYRVEIHKGSGDGLTFKWSRDNGSVVVAVAEFPYDNSDIKIRTTSLGRDDVLCLHENDWVEVVDDATELAGLPGTLVQIMKIEPDNVLTLSKALPGAFVVTDADNNPTHLKVRRWDSDGGNGEGLAVTSGDIDLKGEIQVQFDTTGTYRTGDYWLIPARTVPGQYGDIEWPKDSGNNPLFLPPFGIKHHYCKLAILSFQSNTVAVVEDCRKKFPPLTELPTGGNCCCSVTVGQGGDYADIQSAIDARSDADRWTICVLPGRLGGKDTVSVDKARGLTIRGCGKQSLLVGPHGRPVFRFTNGKDIKLEGLGIEASSLEGAVLFTKTYGITVANCIARNLIPSPAPIKKAGFEEMLMSQPKAGQKDSQPVGGVKAASSELEVAGPLIVINNGYQVEIRENDLAGLPAVQASGREISILHNRITKGGIQIIPPSLDVEIFDNIIAGGAGPGIQLGGGNKIFTDLIAMLLQPKYQVKFPYDPVPANVSKASAASDILRVSSGTKKSESAAKADKTGVALDVLSGSLEMKGFLAAIKEVTIARNLISDMTGSGIITEADFTNPAALGDVEKLRIIENKIVGCCASPDIKLSDAASVGGGIAAMGLFGAQIVNNYITENGNGSRACGIFILDGSDIEISGNMVLENGANYDPDENIPPKSCQAGIAAQFVFGDFKSLGTIADVRAPLNGYPALRVHDNQVICPAGQALTVLAIGGVGIDGNNFSTRERQQQPADPLNFVVNGACVSVVDLGVPIWYPEPFPLIGILLTITGQTIFHIEDRISVDSKHVKLPDGRVLFHNNQVWFNTAIHEKKIEGLKGNNIYDFSFKAWDAATFSALFLSLDDISINANQFQAAVPEYRLEYPGQNPQDPLFWAYLLKFIQVVALGSTIRAIGNGLNERLFSNYISLVTIASMMNVTTSNEATHGFFFLPTAVPGKPNLSLFP